LGDFFFVIGSFALAQEFEQQSFSRIYLYDISTDKQGEIAQASGNNFSSSFT